MIKLKKTINAVILIAILVVPACQRQKDPFKIYNAKVKKHFNVGLIQDDKGKLKLELADREDIKDN